MDKLTVNGIDLNDFESYTVYNVDPVQPTSFPLSDSTPKISVWQRLLGFLLRRHYLTPDEALSAVNAYHAWENLSPLYVDHSRAPKAHPDTMPGSMPADGPVPRP
jgi:hypothetical protein